VLLKIRVNQVLPPTGQIKVVGSLVGKLGNWDPAAAAPLEFKDGYFQLVLFVSSLEMPFQSVLFSL